MQQKHTEIKLSHTYALISNRHVCIKGDFLFASSGTSSCHGHVTSNKMLLPVCECIFLRGEGDVILLVFVKIELINILTLLYKNNYFLSSCVHIMGFLTVTTHHFLVKVFSLNTI